jgi:hypothetical protein
MTIQFFPEHETITMTKNEFLSIYLQWQKERIHKDRILFEKLLGGFKRYLEGHEEGLDGSVVRYESQVLDRLIEPEQKGSGSGEAIRQHLDWLIDREIASWEQEWKQEALESKESQMAAV